MRVFLSIVALFRPGQLVEVVLAAST